MKRSFTQTPNPVIRSGKKISDAEFRLYCTLLSFDFKKGFVFPSRETLGKHMGASRAKIDRVKNSLEKKGAFRKQRRGQGITNLYFLNKDFLYQADDSNMSPLGNSPVSGKEDEVDNTLNNYLPTSSSFKETNFGGETQPLPEPQPKSETPIDIIFRSQLKKIKVDLGTMLSGLTDNQLEEYELSINTSAAIEGIIYYIQKYKAVLGIDHPRYYTLQLRNCFLGFLHGIWDIEDACVSVRETLPLVIERWFASTVIEENNLRLSHFAGYKKGEVNIIFYNCLEQVLLDIGHYREEANADS